MAVSPIGVAAKFYLLRGGTNTMDLTNKETETKLTCSHCGCIIDEVSAFYMDDEIYCQDCLDELTVICDRCGERIFEDTAIIDNNNTLCSSCYDNYFTTCNQCGAIIEWDDSQHDEYDNSLCQRCYCEYLKNVPIKEYGYKPEPIFYGEGRYIGVELEIDDGGQVYSNAESLLDIANEEEELIYIKSDGSLTDGMEIVTHPMSLHFHMNNMPWKEIMDNAVSMGYLSHKTNTCGLHCHVSRNSFGSTIEEQENNIGNILFIVEKFWPEFLKFSRRTQYQMDRWAARYGFKEKPKQIMDNAKKAGLGRYASVNLNNVNTIEFRMWKGTLKYNTLIATLQIVDKICNVACSLSETELQDMSWNEFVGSINQPELITYLKERQLYINEPIEREDEI